MSDLPVRSTRHGPRGGFRIGVLALDTRHRLVPGNVQNAQSFAYPVLYEIVRNVSGDELMRGARTARAAVVRGARALEMAGVDAIVGACGSFAYFQADVARAVRVPVFMSILLQVPFLLRALPSNQYLGIFFASTRSFTPRVRTQCGIPANARIVAVGADSVPAFHDILGQRATLDESALEAGVVELAAKALQAQPRIGIWLIQCSDLPPCAAALQKATGLPVFDMVTLMDHIHAALTRRRFPS